MKPEKGKTYYISYSSSDDPEWTHYDGEGVCVNDQANEQGWFEFRLDTVDGETGHFFDEKHIIHEVELKRNLMSELEEGIKFLAETRDRQTQGQETFKHLGSVGGPLCGFKFWELEYYYHCREIFAFEFSLSHKCDHAGLTFQIAVMGYAARFSIYDCRHWDGKTNSWESGQYR